MSRLRIVLDSNVWVSTLLKPHGHYAEMVKKVAEEAHLFTSEYILAEVREASLRPEKKRKYGLTEEMVDKAIEAIREVAGVLTHLPTVEVIHEDPDDNLVLACALQATADYLVSYDPHLLKLKEYHGIKILTPSELVQELKARKAKEEGHMNAQ
jgi:putative PIN family toxin of toxin-antitoxin system